MSRVTARIKSLYRSLPGSEKKVADFILENTEGVPFLSVYDVAAAVPEIFQAITPNDDDSEIVKKIFKGNVQSLEGL